MSVAAETTVTRTPSRGRPAAVSMTCLRWPPSSRPRSGPRQSAKQEDAENERSAFGSVFSFRLLVRGPLSIEGIGPFPADLGLLRLPEREVDGATGSGCSREYRRTCGQLEISAAFVQPSKLQGGVAEDEEDGVGPFDLRAAPGARPPFRSARRDNRPGRCPEGSGHSTMAAGSASKTSRAMSGWPAFKCSCPISKRRASRASGRFGPLELQGLCDLEREDRHDLRRTSRRRPRRRGRSCRAGTLMSGLRKSQRPSSRVRSVTSTGAAPVSRGRSRTRAARRKDEALRPTRPARTGT